MNNRTESGDSQTRIFGIRAIIEAINADKQIDKLFIQKGLSGELYSELKGLVKHYSINHQYVPIEKINRFTRKNHQGVYAFISPVAFHSIESLLPQVYERGETPLFLVLDRITDVRNFGAIARTAECVGVHAIITPVQNTAPVNEDAIKTSAGALYNIPICKERNLKASLLYLQESGIQLISCTEKTDDLVYDVDYTVPCAIIMGSEEDGISNEFLKMSDAKAKLPLHGNIGSLNVSVATGAILYEATRQRLNKS